MVSNLAPGPHQANQDGINWHPEGDAFILGKLSDPGNSTHMVPFYISNVSQMSRCQQVLCNNVTRWIEEWNDWWQTDRNRFRLLHQMSNEDRSDQLVASSRWRRSEWNIRAGQENTGGIRNRQRSARSTWMIEKFNNFYSRFFLDWCKRRGRRASWIGG